MLLNTLLEHAFNRSWMLSADWLHETGMHGYRRYQYDPGFTITTAVPAPVVVFRSDNRSSYDALIIHLQGNVSKRATLVANYTLSSTKTWGCVLNELFDYVNGVCNPLNAFAKGDYGPSGEDVPHRFVLAGTFLTPGGFELSLLSQGESSRPITSIARWIEEYNHDRPHRGVGNRTPREAFLDFAVLTRNEALTSKLAGSDTNPSLPRAFPAAIKSQNNF